MQHNWLTKGIPTLAEILPKKFTKAKDLSRCEMPILYETLGSLSIMEKEVERLLREVQRAESRVFIAIDRKGAREYAKLGPLPLLEPEERNSETHFTHI